MTQRGDTINGLRGMIESDTRSAGRGDVAEIRERTKEQIERTQTANKSYYDRKHKPVKKFEVGDRVMIRNHNCTPGTSVRLTPRFKNPYGVAKCLRHDRYVIADMEGFHGEFKSAVSKNVGGFELAKVDACMRIKDAKRFENL